MARPAVWESALLLQAIEAVGELQEADDAARPQSSCETLAGQIQTDILAGRLALQCCLVLGAPLTLHSLPYADAPLRPVKLACCGFTVSAAGVRKLLGMPRRNCSFCNASLVKGAALQEDGLVAAAVAAESHGFAPRVFDSADMTVAAGGAAGEVAAGAPVCTGSVGGTRVALKRLQLSKAGAGPKERVGVRQAAAAPYLAGLASPYVCHLHGYCWTDSSLWCAVARDFTSTVLDMHADGASSFCWCLKIAPVYARFSARTSAEWPVPCARTQCLPRPGACLSPPYLVCICTLHGTRCVHGIPRPKVARSTTPTAWIS